MWQPDITVAAICERDGHFLMVEEISKSTNQVVLNQPAGHVEEGETIIDAVIRETLEETRCHFTPQALVGFYRLQIPQGKTYLRYAFCGQVGDADDNLSLDPDILRTHWLSLAQLQQHSALRSDLVLTCVQDYLAGSSYPLELLREL